MSVETVSVKAEICRLFSIMFYNPEDTFLSEPDVVKDLADFLKELNISSEGLVESFENVDKEELMQDYAALFVGPYQLQSPPYGSVYLDKGRRLNDESTKSVADIYRQFGLDVDENMKEPADHIAIELEFLYTAYLIIESRRVNGEDAAELEQSLDAFINKFFKPFVSLMSDLMVKNASTDFYKNIGKQLSMTIEQL